MSGYEGRERGGAGSEAKTGTGRGASRMVKRRSAAERGSTGKIKLIVWMSEVRSGSNDATSAECRFLTDYSAESLSYKIRTHLSQVTSSACEANSAESFRWITRAAAKVLRRDSSACLFASIQSLTVN